MRYIHLKCLPKVTCKDLHRYHTKVASRAELTVSRDLEADICGAPRTSTLAIVDLTDNSQPDIFEVPGDRLWGRCLKKM